MASLRDRSAVRLVIRIKPTEAIEKRTGALAGPGPGSLVVGFADYSKSTSRSGEPRTFGGLPATSLIPFNAVMLNGICMPGVVPFVVPIVTAFTVTVRVVTAVFHVQDTLPPQTSALLLLAAIVVPSWS